MEEQNATASPLATLGTAVGLIAVMVVAVYGLAHASIRPINPEQRTPDGHFPSDCPACHNMSRDARLVQ